MTSLLDKYDRVQPRSRAEWRAWLEANHASSPGIWLVSYTRRSGKATLTYEEAVEEALCFGWIDSQVTKLDDERNMQVFTPRRPGSPWSPTNKRRIERLLAAQLIAPAGLAKIEAAKADGSWTAYDAIEALIVPDDLAMALADDQVAEQAFQSFSNSVKKQLLWWIASAKRSETRAKRIAQLVAAASEGRSALDRNMNVASKQKR